VPGELVSEALGTAIIILFGCGSVAMTVAALNQSDRGKDALLASGDWLLITTGWGVGVALAVWVAGGVSGAHLNPAVTLAHALRRGFPWSKVPSYWAAQIFGAFVGAAIIYLNYHDAIANLETAEKITRGESNSIPTFSIFATFPAPYFSSPVGPLIDQIIGTALLVLLVFAVIDAFNTPVKANLARSSSASSSWGSACRSAPTRATRSTPPATSARGSSPGSRAGSRSRYPATTARSTSSCGSRSSARWSAARWAPTCMTSRSATC
jgi:MIP family channel proteins